MSIRGILALIAAVAAFGVLGAASAVAATEPDPSAVIAADDDAAAKDAATGEQTAEGSGDSLDSGCADYSTQEEAQQALDEDDTDPLNLDPDGNGIACEDLPSESDPAGGVATGGGGTAGVPGPPTAVPAGLVMLALLGAAGALSLLGRRGTPRR